MNTKNKANMTNAYRTVSFPEYDYELKIDQETKNKSEIAIYVLSRSSGEGMDRRLIKGDVLFTLYMLITNEIFFVPMRVKW